MTQPDTAGAPRPPRSAGTRTVVDVVRAAIGRGRSPEDDRDVLDAGGSIRMVVQTRRDGRTRRRQVVLSYDLARTRGLVELIGAPPYQVDRLQGADGPWWYDFLQFRALEGVGAEGRWELAVPAVDVGTVRRVLSRVGRAVPPT